MAARSALSAMFVWAMKTGTAQHNPLIGAYAPDIAPSRDRVLTNSELSAVWRACGDDDLGRIVRLLILTGCRRQEVGGMSWGEFDRERRGLWTIPGAHGRRTIDRMHCRCWRRPGSQSTQFRTEPIASSYLATGPTRGFAGWHLAKQRLDQRLGDAVAPWGLHDLRRSVATEDGRHRGAAACDRGGAQPCRRT